MRILKGQQESSQEQMKQIALFPLPPKPPEIAVGENWQQLHLDRLCHVHGFPGTCDKYQENIPGFAFSS